MIRFILYSSLFLSIPALSQTGTPEKILTGKTTGALPYLEYGMGTDRLGGAKIGYLDTNIVVKVIDSTIGNYRIRLSKDHVAFLPKGNFKKDTTIKLQPYYLTNSWSVTGDDKYDYVVVNLDEKLPYRSMQEIS